MRQIAEKETASCRDILEVFCTTNMVGSNFNPSNVTTIKIKSTEETVNKCAQDKQAVEKQQNTGKKTVAARPWRMMCICVTLICVAAFILVNAAWLLSIYFPPYCVKRTSFSSFEQKHQFADLSGEHSSLDFNEKIRINQTKTSTVDFVQRHEWLALPAKTLTTQQLPVPYVIVSQTSTHNCFSFAECSFQVRFIQQNNMQSQGWADIIYNFLIGDDGRVYVGRDWDKVNEHNMRYDAYSIDVSLIGTIPGKVQLNALQALIENGVQTSKLAPDYKLLAYWQVKNDNSTTPHPKNILYQAIKKLPHWSPDL